MALVHLKYWRHIFVSFAYFHWQSNFHFSLEWISNFSPKREEILPKRIFSLCFSGFTKKTKMRLLSVLSLSYLYNSESLYCPWLNGKMFCYPFAQGLQGPRMLHKYKTTIILLFFRDCPFVLLRKWIIALHCILCMFCRSRTKFFVWFLCFFLSQKQKYNNAFDESGKYIVTKYLVSNLAEIGKGT